MKSPFDEVAHDWHECFKVLFDGTKIGSKEFRERYMAHQAEFDAIENGVLGTHGWTKDEFDNEMALRIFAAALKTEGPPN